jgi:hypothetical protein
VPLPQAQHDSTAPGILRVTLVGHLTLQGFARAVEHASYILGHPGPPTAVIFDCLTMTGYDRATREAFVSWHREHRKRIERAAVVTTNKLWYLVISAMSLAARMPIRPFSTVMEADVWLRDSLTISPASSRSMAP